MSCWLTSNIYFFGIHALPISVKPLGKRMIAIQIVAEMERFLALFLASPVEGAGIVNCASDIHADNQRLFRHLRNLRILCIIHFEPPVCLGCYLLQAAPQAYREVPLFSIGVFYGLQECSIWDMQVGE